MAVYRLEVGAPEEVYERLLADPFAFGVPNEVESSASAVGFHIHLLWLQRPSVRLIVEGDEDPEALNGLLAERLGKGWESLTVARAYEADEPPADLGAGAQSRWVIRMAVGPDDPLCDLCQQIVPPHFSGCPADLPGGGTQTRSGSDPGSSSGSGRLSRATHRPQLGQS